jgi:hypothetical protein
MTADDDDNFETVTITARVVDRVQLFEAHAGDHFAIEFHHPDGDVSRLAFAYDGVEPLIAALQRSQVKTAKRRAAPRH